MKFKTIYIYLIIILAIILYFVFTSGSDTKETLSNIEGSEMPQDEIHKSLDPSLGNQPSKSNVRKDVIERINKMKSDVEANPGDTAKVKEYARFLTTSHKLDQAADYYNQILSKDPKRIDILTELTFVYFSKKDFNKAEEITRKVLQIDPNNHEALFNMGAISASRGETETAKKRWNELIEKYPGSKAAKLASDAVKSL